MSDILRLTRFGNPILREPVRRLSSEEILSESIQSLISDMYYTLKEKKYGVGMAAPQVGRNIALAVIGIKPTPTRPKLDYFDAVLINPEVVETYGYRKQMWEACISSGTGINLLYGKVPRYKSIKLRWLDDSAVEHEEILTGMAAHVAQHETDHLSGTLFVDKVKDPTSFMMADEYRKRVVS